jgi:hypothetical protein
MFWAQKIACDVLESHDAIPDKKVLEEIVNENWETISANIAELVECVRVPQQKLAG